MSAPAEYDFDYPLSITYTGSWRLVWWVEDYNRQGNMVNKTLGNMTGSGYYETTIGFMETAGVWTVCANATKLDSSQNNLTLSVFQTRSTTAPYGSAVACGSIGAP